MAHESFGHRLVRQVAVNLLSLVIVLALIAGAAYLVLNQKPDIADESWLVLDLYGDLPEYAPPGSFPANLLADDTLTLQDALDAMAKAARDDRVAGVIWKLSAANGAGWASLQELRDGITAVRDTGKPVYAWGDYLDLKTLYLAAACDSIFQPRGGYCEVRGLRRESMHLRAMLDKLGIEPHLSKIREYKGAAELVMETEMTDPVREQAQRMLERNWDEVIGTLERERGLTRQRLLAAMDHAALLPQQALDFGLIDGLLYWQDLEARLLSDSDLHVLPTVTPFDYRDVAWEDLGRKGKATVAVVHAQGTIAGRESGVNPLLGITMGHESVVADLQRARLDDDVKAIVLRVDSPGGEGLASDLIGHEVALCAAAKPTVVSMGDVAASGGYQIAFRATRLLADPLSVVGSIGSISGYFDMSGLYDRIGLDKDGVEVGPLAGLGRDDRAPTSEEWEAFVAAHEAGFADWLHEVAEERGLSFAEAEQLAYGRVFTGREAVANGLIDGLGNLQAAIREAASLAGVAPETALSVVHLPEQPGLLESLFGDDPAPGSPVTAAARYLLHKQLRTELMETRRLLQTEVLAR